MIFSALRHDVIVGDDVALRIDDEPGAEADDSRPVSGMPRLSKNRRRKSSNGRPPGRSGSSSPESSSLRAVLSPTPCAEIVTTAEETCWTSGARLGIGIGRLFGTCAVRFLSPAPAWAGGLRICACGRRRGLRLRGCRRAASATAPPQPSAAGNAERARSRCPSRILGQNAFASPSMAARSGGVAAPAAECPFASEPTAVPRESSGYGRRRAAMPPPRPRPAERLSSGRFRRGTP